MDVKSRVSFVVAAIPAHNEEKTIAKVVLEAQKYVDKVVVCDDGSDDLTAEIADKLGADVVSHTTNKGYGTAVQTLFGRTLQLGATTLVMLDADGQHNPSEIPSVIEPILEGNADIVVGSRFLNENKKTNNVPKYRQIGIKIITRLSGAASKHVLSDCQSGFRAYNRKAIESLELSEKGMGISIEILMEAKKKGLKIAEVPISCNYKGLDTSSNGAVIHGVGLITSLVRLLVEDRPLLVIGVPGLISIAVGAIFGIWMIQIYTMEKIIITNIALASIAFILIGLFAIFTAITLYSISRMYQKMKKLQALH